MMIIKEFREKKHENRAEGDPSEIRRRPGEVRKITPRGRSFHYEALSIKKKDRGPFHIFPCIRSEKCLRSHRRREDA